MISNTNFNKDDTTHHDIHSNESSPSAAYNFYAPKAKELFHTEESDFFIGRRETIDKIVNQLKLTKKSRGCYLVGGYRGVGKTTTVRHALNEYKLDISSGHAVIDIYLNLSDDTYRGKKGLLIEILENLKSEIQNQINTSFRLTSILLLFIGLFLFASFSLYNSQYEFLKYILLEQKNDTSIILSVISEVCTNYNYTWFYIFSSLSFFIFSYIYFKSENKLLKLINSTIDSTLNEISTTNSGKFSFTDILSLGKSTTKKATPLSDHQIQQKIEDILNYARLNKFSRSLHADHDINLDISFSKKYLDIIFIFDELDKINCNTSDKSSEFEIQETLLSNLKSFLSTAKTRFIFISDRKLLDRYYSESVSKNSLYDGIFDYVFYVRSLLTDPGKDSQEPVLHRAVEDYLINLLSDRTFEKYIEVNKTRNKRTDINLYVDFLVNEYNANNSKALHEKHIKNIRYFLHRFIEYLTFYSWGIPRHINSLVKRHLVLTDRDTNKYFLCFKDKDLKWITFTSKFYQTIDNHLSNHLSRSDDKLIISTIVGTHEILRYFNHPFSKQFFDRTNEGINSHWDPNLHSTLENITENVLSNSLRKIRSGIYEYRFHSHIQEEIKEITRHHGAEASTFIFGPDTTGTNIQYFKDELKNIQNNKSEHTLHSEALILNILGDLCFWEKFHDAAINYYSQAAASLKKILRFPDEFNSRTTGLPSFSSQYLLVKTQLKMGLTEELRNDYDTAIKYYRSAADAAKEYLGIQNHSPHQAKIITPFQLQASNKCTNKKITGDIEIENALLDFWNRSKDRSNYRESLLLSIICIEAVNFKIGKPGRDDVSKTIPKIQPVKDKKTNFLNNYNSDALLKLLTVRLIGNQSKLVEDKLSIFIQNIVNNVSKPEDLNLNYSESMLVVLFCQSKLINLYDSGFRPKTEVISELMHLTTKSAYLFTGRNHVITIFLLLYISARRLEDLGYKVRSAYVYAHIYAIWNFIKEGLIEHNNIKIDFKIIDDKRHLLHIIKKRMYKSSSMSDLGVLYNNRYTWLNKFDYGNEGDARKLDKNYSTEQLQNILDPNTSDNYRDNLHSTFIFWHRSGVELTVLLTDYWSVLTDKIINNDGNAFTVKNEKKKTNPHCINSTHFSISEDGTNREPTRLLGSPRMRSVYYWVSSRYFLEVLKANINNNNISDTIDKHFKDGFKTICRALVNINSSFIDGSPMTFPIKGLVYYDLCILLSLAYNYYNCSLFEKHEKLYDEVSKSYRMQKSITNLSSVIDLCESEFSKLEKFRYRDSQSYKEMLNNQYFLLDDFNDPVLKMDWVLLRLYSSTIRNKVNIIKELKNNSMNWTSILNQSN